MATLKENMEAIKLEKDTKILPENLKSGITAFGVTGIFEGSGTTGDGPVKLFETTEEMNADTNSKENDLALVYRSEIRNADGDSKFQTATFPKTVVLPEAIGEDTHVNISCEAVDNSVMLEGWGSLDSFRFDMTIYTETEYIGIEYESSDGMTYTRTDGGEETVDFGTELQFSDRYGEFNDNVGYFIRVGGNVFDGIYQYTTKQDPNHLALYKMTKQNDGLKGYGSELVSISDEPIHETIRSLLEKTSGKTVSDYDGYKIADDTYRIILSNVNSSSKLNDNRFIFDGTNLYAGIAPYSGTFIAYQFDVDLNSNTCTQTQLDVSNLPTLEHGGNTTSYYEKIDTGLAFSTSGRIECVVAYTDASSGAMSWVTTDYDFPIVNISKYRLAPTQLTLGATNELYPGKIAYGKKRSYCG